MTGRIFRLGVGGVVAAMMLAAFAAPVAAASTKWVDDDAGASGGPPQCATAAYTSIQDAIDASSNWGTVNVCDGTYVEQLDLHKKGILVQSRPKHGAHIVAPAVLTGTPGTIALVDLSAWASRLVGFRIDIPAGGSTTSTTAGLVSVACSHVDSAVVAEGGRNRVASNIIRPMGALSLSGVCGFDYGIVVVGPVVAGAVSPAVTGPGMSRVSKNQIRDFKWGGVLAEGGLVRVDHNRITFLHANDPECSFPIAATNAGPSICISSTHLATSASANHLARTLATNARASFRVSPQNGIFTETFGVLTESSAADVELNVIHSGLGLFGPSSASALAGGVVMLDAVGTSRVRGNHITNVFAGVIDEDFVIVISGAVSPALADGIEISRNEITDSYLGIAVGGDVNNVWGNSARLNVIGIDVGGAENNIHNNDFTFNLGIGCLDDSPAGGGTVGTSNWWTNNVSTDSGDPEGICDAVLT